MRVSHIWKVTGRDHTENEEVADNEGQANYEDSSVEEEG